MYLDIFLDRLFAGLSFGIGLAIAATLAFMAIMLIPNPLPKKKIRRIHRIPKAKNFWEAD